MEAQSGVKTVINNKLFSGTGKLLNKRLVFTIDLLYTLKLNCKSIVVFRNHCLG